MLGSSLLRVSEQSPPPLRGRVREGGGNDGSACGLPPSPPLPRKGGESRPAALQTTSFKGALVFSTGAALEPYNCRRMRSIGRRGSHRLRIRRGFAEKALITIPLHDPLPDRAVTVANQLRVEHRRAPPAPHRARRRARRLHDPAGF